MSASTSVAMTTSMSTMSFFMYAFLCASRCAGALIHLHVHVYHVTFDLVKAVANGRYFLPPVWIWFATLGLKLLLMRLPGN